MEDLENYKEDLALMKAGQFKQDFEDSENYKKLRKMYSHLDEIKSIYIWGDPGCGKSFIAEQFFESLPIENKKFMHY